MAQSFSWEKDSRWQELVAEAALNKGGPDIWVYQSAHDSWLTSSYYFELNGEVVLIDTQTFRSSAEELLQDIRENTSGNITTIILTHAHPDHVYGTPVFRKAAPHARVITSRGVADDMKRTIPPRVAYFADIWGDEAPQEVGEVVFPDLVFEGTLELTIAGTTFKMWEVGPAETPAQIVVSIPELDALAVGDVLQNRQTYYTTDCALPQWYALLDDLEEVGASRLLTGHHGIGGPELFNETRSWFSALLGLLSEALGPERDPQDVHALTDEQRTRIVDEMTARFPDWFDAAMTGDGDTNLSFSLVGTRTEDAGEEVLAARESDNNESA